MAYEAASTFNDAYLSSSDKALISTYKSLYESAKAQGNEAQMSAAHEAAQAVRASYGYSGGADGSQYIPLAQTGSSQAVPAATSREPEIQAVYQASQASALAALESAYKASVADIDYEAGKIPGLYRQSANNIAASAAIGDLSTNEYMAARGLNTGASGQVMLARRNVLQGNLSANSTAEAQALADVEAERAKLNLQYQSSIAKAIADNDLAKAQALYEEAVRIDNSIVDTAYKNAALQAQAQQQKVEATQYADSVEQSRQAALRQYAQDLAKTGDYSGYAALGWTQSQIAAATLAAQA